ncbi:phage tail protein [Brevibacillus sp. 179-C9.3 HS]|uniref:phage tail protein n=1 Tax=unclassified Brevibacillus TaxID=2684853 RepID=UPI0039A0C15A
MADAFFGEIRIFAGSFPPKDWAFCNGQLIPIHQNTALFSILGVQFGGDGKSTFALPNLQGKVPMGQGAGPGLTPRVVGEIGGVANVTLLHTNMPAHTHEAKASNTPTIDSPVNAIWSSTSGRGGIGAYGTTSDNTHLSPEAIGITGETHPHSNMQPYLGLSFIICLNGIFPPRG